MKTTKPISTISYNHQEYLVNVLDDLMKSKIIEFYIFIPHLPDEDEKKPHIHVYVEPAKLLQTMDLVPMFKEPNPKEPRGVLQFHLSKFVDWYLYGLHDKRYLALKGQSRIHHYQDSDFVSSSDDELKYRIQNADLSFLTPLDDMMTAISRGMSLLDFARIKHLTPKQVYEYKYTWELITNEHTQRNGKQTHTPKIIQTQPQNDPFADDDFDIDIGNQ